MPTAPSVSRTSEMAVPVLMRRRRARRRVVLAALVVVLTLLMDDPRSTDAELEGGSRQDDDEERDGYRRGVADLVVREGLLGEVHDDASCRVAGAATVRTITDS